MAELEEVIILSSAIIDRKARMIIERDGDRVLVFMAGVEPRQFTGDEARELWNLYDKDKGYRFTE